MRNFITPLILAGSAALAGCNTVEGAVEDVASVADAATTPAGYRTCSNYGMIDRDGDGFIEATEWNAFRTNAYTDWDINNDGRVDRNEFGACWYGGGFATTGFDRDAWEHHWTAFDADRSGHLDRNEFFGTAAWTRLDRDRDDRIDLRRGEWRFR